MENTSATLERTDNFFRKPYSITSVFTVAVLLFLLPFVQVKCASTTLLENSGIGMVTGKPWKVSMSLGREYMNKLKSPMRKGEENIKLPPNIFAIAALAIGTLGIIFSLLKSEWRSVFSMCAGILAAIMLIALFIQMKITLRPEPERFGGDDAGVGMSGILKVQFTIWYFLSLFGFASAGYLGYKHNREELNERLKHAKDFEFERKNNSVSG